MNYVDDEIFGKMEADRVPAAPRSSDTEFLRRVTLDLTGRIPDADVVVAFVADPSPDKRSRMVDALLASDAFVDRWTFYYDELFQNTNASSTGSLWNTANAAYHAYFQDAVRSRKPWDVMARELITASGPNTTVGPANFIVRHFQNNGPPRTRTTTSRSRPRGSSSGRASCSARPATTGRAISTRSTSGARS